MTQLKIGFAMCGSFCTFSQIPQVMKNLVEDGHSVTPIMSATAYSTDTRFGKAKEINAEIENICKSKILSTISEVEPIGPKKLLDVLIVAPCTGNTVGKLANGIYDSSVTLAVKAHLRNNRPVVIAISTNDALSAAAANIGKLMNTKNIFFVPFAQDDAVNKPNSLVADFSQIPLTVENAINNMQAQPLLTNQL